MRSLHVRCGFKHYILEKNPYIKILKRFKSKTIEISRTIINSMKKKMLNNQSEKNIILQINSFQHNLFYNRICKNALIKIQYSLKLKLGHVFSLTIGIAFLCKIVT